MTQFESAAVECLQHVRYPPASWDKRFAHSLPRPDNTITDAEAPQVWRLLKRYRRQIMDRPDIQSLLLMADTLAAPDFRALQRIKTDRERYSKAMETTPKNTPVANPPLT